MSSLPLGVRPEYDVIVVGGGPAGLMAARMAALGGVSVLVLEKDREIGVPVRCGEAVGAASIAQFVEPDPKFIAAEIDAFRFFSPDGRPVIAHLGQNRGFMLDRRVFDGELAKRAAEAGAEIRCRAYVHGLLKDGPQTVGVEVSFNGYATCQIRAALIIGADGVESRIGRWAGLKTVTELHDLESCAQYTLANLPLDRPTTLDFYVGESVAPGGYGWVFPKGPDTANVGLGIVGTYLRKRGKPTINYLNDFVKRLYGDTVQVVSQTVGCVPCADTRQRLTAPGVLLVGDAGHQVNPLSGGGIASGMIGGALAGEVAARSIRRGKLAEIAQYDKAWQKRLGKRHHQYYRLKEGVAKLSDEHLNRTADLVLGLKPEERTLTNIFKAGVRHQPGLIQHAIRLFAGL